MGSFQYTRSWGRGLIGYRGQLMYVRIGSLADCLDFSIGKMNTCIVFLEIGTGVGVGGRKVEAQPSRGDGSWLSYA